MRRVSWIFRLAGVVLAGALFITAITIGIAPRLWGVANSHDETPVELPQFEPLAQRSYVYDRYGNEIAVFEKENVQPFKLAQVPPIVVQAILAVEDQEFYVHHGVNVRSMIRATLSNFSSGASRQGASTVTQQVVKNEFLATIPRDGRYKFLQVHYATMLEKRMSKDDILERYLNTIFFGNNSYGLAAAAETYFGVSVEQLTMEQGAFLAGLIRSPSGYDPFRQPERARARFDQVLGRLVDVGMITDLQKATLLETWPIPEVPQVIPGRTTTPTYFTEALQDYLLNKSSDILGTDEQQRRSTLLRGGLRIYTTIDPLLQAKAEFARGQLPDTVQGFDAAIVSLDTTNGAIRVMVGGRGFKRNVNEVNMALVPRQTGSSIKFFILAAALEAGAQPSDLLDGALPCVLPNPGNPKEPFEIKQGVSKGVGTLDLMTYASINCAYSRLAQIVGLYRVVDTTYRMAHSPYLYSGQTREERGGVEPIQPYASYATGANEMSPLDMASGAQTVANQGLHHDPYFVDSVDKADGTRLYTHEDPGVQVLEQGVALTEIDMLKHVLGGGGTGHRYPLAGGRPAAGKTGTQDDNTNSWFVGFTPQLTTSVWVGNPNGYISMDGIPEFVRDGVPKVQGGTYPEKIWKAYMDSALADQPPLDWPAPPAPARKAARLYLPGHECLAQLVSGVIADPNAPTTVPTTTAPPTTIPGDTSGVVPTAPTAPPPPVLKALDSGTTIAPDVLDPHAPVPSVDPKKIVVFNCQRGVPGATINGKVNGNP